MSDERTEPLNSGQPCGTMMVKTESEEYTFWSSVSIGMKRDRAGLCSLGLREIQHHELRSLLVIN